MSSDPIDVTRVERTLERRLREQGLFPRAVADGVSTGLNRLRLYRGEIQVAQVPVPGQPAGYLVSVDVRAALEHPQAGNAEISDLVTVQSNSIDEALELGANTYMDVTFPVLRSLFDGKPATGAVVIKLSGFVPAQNRTIEWEAYSSNVQMRDDSGRLGGRLIHQAPLLMMFNTLSKLLTEPRLHWCKIYGCQQASAGLVFGCVVDGSKSPEAEAELRARFEAAPVPGEWEFRQFAALLPVGQAAEPTVVVKQQEAAEPAAPAKKRWWSWRK